jgi:hypothetical protein
MQTLIRLKYLSSFFLFFLLVIIIGCNQPSRSIEVVSDTFVISDFNPMSNWPYDLQGKESGSPLTDKAISLDYSEAKEKGFIIPTVRQVKEGCFRLEFRIKNTGKAPQKFYYKIFYQNESYKFPERDEFDSTKQNENCWENFYGSWEEMNRTFTETEIGRAHV